MNPLSTGPETPPAAARLADDAQALLQLLAAGGTVAQALDLPPRQLEALYAHGVGQYGQGRLDEAVRVFSLLVMLDHGQRRWVQALATALQAQGHPGRALPYWALVQLLDPSDPEPTLATAHCLLAQGLPREALSALQLVVRQCEVQPARAALGRRAQGLLPLVQARIDRSA